MRTFIAVAFACFTSALPACPPSEDTGEGEGEGEGNEGEGEGEGEGDIDPASFEYGADDGCLTFTGASDFCGFNSDGAICVFAAGCGAGDANLGQCQINCEQSAEFSCYDLAAVTCAVNALDAEDCTAFVACNFTL